MNRLRLGLVVVVALAAVSGGVAWAAGVADALVGSDGTISACVQRNEGQTRIVAAGTPCRADEQALAWNERGPRGPKGDQGDPGPPGPAGPGFVGAGCAGPGGDGTIAQSIAADGTITFRCDVATAPTCTASHATASCDASGALTALACSFGWANDDGNLENGCEQRVATAEVCNGIDDDADGIVDDHTVDTGSVYHGETACVNGAIDLACDAGYVDDNKIPTDGCELEQAQIVECGDGFPTIVAPMPVEVAHVVAWSCANGSLAIGACVQGWSDANGVPRDGCEAKLD